MPAILVRVRRDSNAGRWSSEDSRPHDPYAATAASDLSRQQGRRERRLNSIPSNAKRCRPCWERTLRGCRQPRSRGRSARGRKTSRLGTHDASPRPRSRLPRPASAGAVNRSRSVTAPEPHREAGDRHRPRSGFSAQVNCYVVAKYR